MNLTLGVAKTTIARILGRSTSSSSVMDYINEAVERLMSRGNWPGTIVRYRACVNQAKITWPRQIETILKANVCDTPAPIANHWYEFAGSGPGTLHDTDCPGLVLEDMGNAPTFDDIGESGKLLYVLSTAGEDADAQILIRGYGGDATTDTEPIRTVVDGSWVEGEYIDIAPGATFSTKYFINITEVIKPVTNGVVRLYEFTAPATYKPLAYYDPDETVPSYRRSRIPSLATFGECDCDCCPTDYTSVTVLAKLAFIRASVDTDILQINNLPAIKDMVMSIQHAEKHNTQEAVFYEGRALRELQMQAKNADGGGTFPYYDVQDKAIYGAGDIEAVI